MEEIVFHSQDELYRRVLPALRSKKKMLVSDGYKMVNESDIWNYMRRNKWNLSYGLELCEMVDDILNTDNEKIVSFVHNVILPKKEVVDLSLDLPKLKS